MTLARQSGQVAREIQRFGDLTERLRSLSTTLASRFARITAAFEFTFSSVTAVVFVLGAWFVSQGDVSLGTPVLFLLYIRLVQGPITTLSGLRYESLRAGLAFDRVFEVIQAPESRMSKLVTDSVSSAAAGPASFEAGQARACPELAFEEVQFEYKRPEEIAIASLSRLGAEQAVSDLTPSEGRTRKILAGISFSVSRRETVTARKRLLVERITHDIVGAVAVPQLGGVPQLMHYRCREVVEMRRDGTNGTGAHVEMIMGNGHAANGNGAHVACGSFLAAAYALRCDTASPTPVRGPHAKRAYAHDKAS